MIIIFFMLLLKSTLGIDDRFLGCYKNSYTDTYNIQDYSTVEQCIGKCRQEYYRYLLINHNGLCSCVNQLGEEVNSTMLCNEFCSYCDLKSNLSDVYVTGKFVPSVPRDVLLTNVTEKSLQISWKAPKFYTDISGYLIRAIVNHTYANFLLSSPEWAYSNDTFQTKIILMPATKYNITLCAMSSVGPGNSFWQIVQTQVGEPDNLPELPKIIKKYGDKLEIKIMEAMNNNGPVSGYLVVVLNNNNKQFFQEELLKPYDQAKKEGISYYIAAEVKPERIHRNFVVGDGHNYNGYYNAPLEENTDYTIIIGVVSTLNSETKRAFSSFDSSEADTWHEKTEAISGDSPALIIGLSIGIGFLSFMFVAGIVGFIILKSRVANRRHRLSENQELTLQGPMIEVENNGYIPEEEHSKASHYKNLKQKLKSIPYNQLKIEPTNLLGIGRFGRVNSGSIYESDTLAPAAVYSIQDKKLSPEDKKSMLKDLDILIKTDKSENVLALLGTCETSQVVMVVLEYVPMNLKDFLLGNREALPGRFSSLTESQALDIAGGVAKGMIHLAANKIVHKQLCARNVMVTNEFVPKVSGYGLAQFYSHNNIPDYTRWTALEVFKGQPHNVKSDVWSFGCVLWEICVLGGTPYANFSNNDVTEKVTRGLRLPQVQYFSDELYQLMLDCWQVDMDQRPSFDILVESLQTLNENSLIPSLSFSLFHNFQYEQFYPDMEIAVRPVF